MASRIRRINKLGLAAVSAVVLIVATALASLAATKAFVFTVSPGPVTAGSDVTLDVRVMNKTPSATINSFSVTVPVEFDVTGLPSQGPSNNSTTVPPNQSAQYLWDGVQTVSVQFLDPIKNGKYFTLNIPTHVASAVACGNTTVTWPSSAVTPWTGSNLSGTKFIPDSTQTTQTTTITMTCSLSFTAQPSAVAKNTAISPAVEVTDSDGSNGVVVTISKASGPGALSSGGTTCSVSTPCTATTATVNSVPGVASFPDLKLDTAGTYTLQAAATGYGTATSSEFTVYESTITCNGGTQSFDGTDTTVDLSSDGSCAFPTTVTDDKVDIAKPDVDGSTFDITIVWGLAVPNDDPQSAHTEITVNGQTFTPKACDLTTNNGYPINPDTDGIFYPGGSAEQPWCLAAYSWDGTSLSQTFKGAGDPSFTRTK